MFGNGFEKGCILVIGGAKSGKSRYALNICNSLDKDRIFLATSEAGDREMEERIRRHQAERGESWRTVEEPIAIAEVISSMDNEQSIILFDCVTLWLNNLYMTYGPDTGPIDASIEELIGVLSDIRGAVVLVTNEVGAGVVPDNPLARRYRDAVGDTNQRLARVAKKVVLLIAGLPLVLKDE